MPPIGIGFDDPSPLNRYLSRTSSKLNCIPITIEVMFFVTRVRGVGSIQDLQLFV